LFAKPPELSTQSVRRGSPEDEASADSRPRKRRRCRLNAVADTVTAAAVYTERPRRVTAREPRKPRKVQRQSYIAMERLCTLCAIINALNALKRGNIVSSWKASGLHPFTGVPPVTEEYCNRMLNEMYLCENLGVKPRPRTSNSIIIVGLVNNEEGLERFEKLLREKELKPTKYSGRYNNGTSRIVTENEDVGDYVTLETDDNKECATDGHYIYGNTDAECHVPKKKHRRRFFLRTTVRTFSPYYRRGRGLFQTRRRFSF